VRRRIRRPVRQHDSLLTRVDQGAGRHEIPPKPRCLPGADHDKDIEILSLRHQLAVLQRQLDGPAGPVRAG
jgi:hypothetical protein